MAAVLTLVAVAALAWPQINYLENLTVRNLGPTTMGGRIMDLAVYERDPRIFYVATASGGLWKTENAGMTLAPVFEREATIALGACAVSQRDPNLVWVGTGEGSSRNSVSWGDGVYKSTDGGKTWKNMGLRETMFITRILIDPRNDNVVYVAALGHLWGTNPERGVYKTTDGGATWNLVLKIDERTGIADMRMDPKNPDVLLAAGWERIRYPWDFVSGGPGSGLYKTTNGGRSWRKITRGLPEGPIGRMGISYFRKDPRIVVMTIEYRPPVTPGTQPDTGIVRTRAGGTYRSTDGGESWSKVNDLNPRPFYFSTPMVDPVDDSTIYVLGINLHVSRNRGETFTVLPINARVHVDHHAIWIDPNNSDHILLGNDGGVSQSRDRGATWEHLNFMPLAQYYAVGVDMRKPYWVYGGLQDNGSWGGPTQTTRGSVSFLDFHRVGGGDGFYVQVDPNDWTTLYSESQGGAVSRVNQVTGETRFIRPRPPQGEQYRFNWNTPIHISPHNSHTIYVGGNRLFRSVNRGDTWDVISPDLTTNDPEKLRPGRRSVTPEDTGAERHCTITTISESPLRSGLIWVGTDDGQVHVTQDGGRTWTNVADRIPDHPKLGWVSRVIASRHAPNRAYVTFDDHRRNNFGVYVYVTDDGGQTWRSLAKGLTPNQPVHVIREGERNPALLYLGTEMAVWASLDLGESWMRLGGGFPSVPVHDLVVHPRELDLVVGTHGRGIYIVNTAGLEDLVPATRVRNFVLTRPQTVYLLGRTTGAMSYGDRLWTSPNTQPGTYFQYLLRAEVPGGVKIRVLDAAGTTVHEMDGPGKPGFHSVYWNARARGRLLAEGDYSVVLAIGEERLQTSLRVESLVEQRTAGQGLP